MDIKSFETYTFFPGQHWCHTWERQHELITRFALELADKELQILSPLGLINHNPFSFDFLIKIKDYSKQQKNANLQNPIQPNMRMVNLRHIPFHDNISAFINFAMFKKQINISKNNFFWSTYMNPELYKIFKKSKFRVIDLAERRGANPFLSDEIKALERKAVAEADLVIIDNHACIEDYMNLNRNIFYIPQGVNKNSFYKIEGENRKYIGYIGNLHFAIDYDYLEKLIISNFNENFLLIGGVLEQKANRILSLKNVKHIHQIPKDELNMYLAQVKIGLIPYLIDERTKGVYPTKLFEYLSAGVPVLSTPLPEVAQYANNEYLRISYDLLNLSEISFGCKNMEEVVAANTWDSRWSEYLKRIESC